MTGRPGWLVAAVGLLGALGPAACHGDEDPPAACDLDPPGPDCETLCEPGRAFCDPDDLDTLFACTDDGQAVEEIGACGRGLVCFDGGGAPPRCRPRECEPGVVACDPDGADRIVVCDGHGVEIGLLTDCAAVGRTVRCGPEPVCVDDQGDGPPCDEDADCGADRRCTAAGAGGAPRLCVDAGEQGDSCLIGGRGICQRGLACVFEHGALRPADRGVCRPSCDAARNDCADGQACLLTAAGGVCSTVVSPRHREPCDTGKPAPCDAGQVIEGLSNRCLPLTRPATAEACDGVDEDCDGQVDEGYDLQTDALHCGACHKPCGRLMTCEQGVCTCPEGYRDSDGEAANGCECLVTAEGIEQCDRRDNDCDGQVDEGFDLDGDGWPSAANCHPTGQADCDDDDDERHPGRPETCDGTDEDCDQEVDEDFDLAADPSHCGGCGRSCVVPHAERRCIDGFCPWECPPAPEGEEDPGCRLRCIPGHLDENALPEDGCEATPCTLAAPPIATASERIELPGDAPHGLTWQTSGQGWVLAFEPALGQDTVRSLTVEAGVASIGPPATSEDIDDVVFPVTGLAWDGAAVAVIDAQRSRIVLADPADLVAYEDSLMPAPAGEGRWRGLAWDGDGWWFSGDVAGTVLKMRPGQNAARRVVATGPVAGLDVDVAGDRVFVTVRDRLCRHVAATGQCLTCEAIQAAPGLLGPVAWDGEALWVVDPGAPALLRMPTPAEQAEEADEGEGP